MSEISDKQCEKTCIATKGKRKARTRSYNPDKYNFSKPYLTTREAAAYLCCAETSLRISRCHGTLFGVSAPPYIKRGHSVAYETKKLIEWHDQFEEKTNTAQKAS